MGGTVNIVFDRVVNTICFCTLHLYTSFHQQRRKAACCDYSYHEKNLGGN